MRFEGIPFKNQRIEDVILLQKPNQKRLKLKKRGKITWRGVKYGS